MRDLLETVDTWGDEGSLALATVVRTSGSTPRPVGAKMIMSRSGKMAGSVSGGCLEAAVYDEAMAVLESGRPTLIHYGITDDMAWDVGLACGGEVDIFIEPYD